MERLRKLLTTSKLVRQILCICVTLSLCLGLGVVKLHAQEPRAIITDAMNLYWKGLEWKELEASLSLDDSSSLQLNQDLQIQINSWLTESQTFYQQWLRSRSVTETRGIVISQSLLPGTLGSTPDQGVDRTATILGMDEHEAVFFSFLQDLWNFGITLLNPDSKTTTRTMVSQLLDIQNAWRFFSPQTHGTLIQVATLPLSLAASQSSRVLNFLQTHSPKILVDLQQMFFTFVMTWEQESKDYLKSQKETQSIQGDFKDPIGLSFLQEAAAALQRSSELEIDQFDQQFQNQGLSSREMHWHWLSLLQDRRAAQQVLVRSSRESDHFIRWLEQEVAGFLELPVEEVQQQVSISRWIASGSTQISGIDSVDKALGVYGSFFRQEDQPGPLETLRVLSYWGILLDRPVVEELLEQIQLILTNQVDPLSGLPENQMRMFLQTLENPYFTNKALGLQTPFSTLAFQYLPLLSLIEDPIEHVALFDRFLLGLRVLLQQSKDPVLSGLSYSRNQSIIRISQSLLDDLYDAEATPIETIQLVNLFLGVNSTTDMLTMFEKALGYSQ